MLKIKNYKLSIGGNTADLTDDFFVLKAYSHEDEAVAPILRALSIFTIYDKDLMFIMNDAAEMVPGDTDEDYEKLAELSKSMIIEMLEDECPRALFDQYTMEPLDEDYLNAMINSLQIMASKNLMMIAEDAQEDDEALDTSNKRRS